ncbi:10152_t:CDS:2, partial [Acaulospora morrowiae]
NGSNDFVSIEGNEGIELGEDRKLLVKWGLTEETADRLCCNMQGPIWSQQMLKHWLLDWIYNLWDTSVQISFNAVFYNSRFQHNEWHSYERDDDPQMFASSYEEIVTIGKDGLISCNTKVSNPTDSNPKAFFHATDYQSAKYSISVIMEPNLFIAKSNVTLGNLFSISDLISDENLWREVVIALRCEKRSAVDDDDFVYGYQLSNPREIVNAYNRSNSKDPWQNLIPLARWVEHIRHLQLVAKTNGQ